MSFSIDVGRLLLLIMFCVLIAPIALLVAYADVQREMDYLAGKE